MLIRDTPIIYRAKLPSSVERLSPIDKSGGQSIQIRRTPEIEVIPERVMKKVKKLVDHEDRILTEGIN